MSSIDTLRTALFGDPPVNPFKPSREGVLAAITELKGETAAAQLLAASADVYNNALATVLPRGVMSITIGGTAITGATVGRYPLTFTGGSVTGAAADLVVDTATTAHIEFKTDGQGNPTYGVNLAGGTTAPTITNPTGATLPSGATLTPALGILVPIGSGYWAVTADSKGLGRWLNDGSGSPVAVNKPDGSQLVIYDAATIDTSIAASTAKYQSSSNWYNESRYEITDRATGNKVKPAAILDFRNWRFALPASLTSSGAVTANLNGLTNLRAATISEVVAAFTSTAMTYVGADGLIHNSPANSVRRDWLVGSGLRLDSYYNNWIKNPIMAGAASGSPGTMPTGWALSLVAGISSQIVTTGTLGDVPYMDIRIYGTNSSGSDGYCSLRAGALTDITAAAGNNVCFSTMGSVSGNTAGLKSPSFATVAPVITAYNSGASLAQYPSAQGSSGFSTLLDQRYASAAMPANTTHVVPSWSFVISAGGVVDFTLRVYAPQLNIGQLLPNSFLPGSTGSAPTRHDSVANSADRLQLASLLGAIFTRGTYTAAVRYDPIAQLGQSRLILGLNASNSGVFLNNTGLAVGWYNGSSTLTAGMVAVPSQLGVTFSSDGTTRRLCANQNQIASDTNVPGGDFSFLALGSGLIDYGYADGIYREVVIWPVAGSDADLIRNASYTTPSEAAAVLPAAPSFAATKRVDLWSGQSRLLPKGWITIYDIGPFLSLERYNPMQKCWSVAKKTQGGMVPPFWCDGVNWRMVNTVNCCIYAAITNSGSGYSKSNPPVITVNSAPSQGRTSATFRCIVGGAISVTIVSGGVYDLPPTLEFDYSSQTPPFKPAQISFAVNSTTGALTGVFYDGNDDSDQMGAQNTWSGAGLTTAGLTWKIIRDPNDTQTSDAVISVAYSSASDAKVTAVQLLTHGAARGNNDPRSGYAITHNGGSGLTVNLMHNHYITGAVIVDPGSYYFTDLGSGVPFKSYLSATFTGSISGTTLTVTSISGDPLVRGAKLNTAGGVAANTYVGQQLTGTPGGTGTYQVSVSQTKSSGTIYSDRWDYPPIIVNSDLDDEESRPVWQPGSAIFTGGALTAVNVQGIGPGFQNLPRFSVTTPQGATCVRTAIVAPNTGSGGDYFTYEVQ